MKLETVEDYLEVLAGLQGNDKIKIESVDCTILYSIARQVFKGKAFTDRQLDVVCMKLNYYNDQFRPHFTFGCQRILPNCQEKLDIGVNIQSLCRLNL